MHWAHRNPGGSIRSCSLFTQKRFPRPAAEGSCKDLLSLEKRAPYKNAAVLKYLSSLCIGCRVLVLESVNLFRKYISFLDVLISCLLPRDALFILTEEETEQAKVRCVAPA